MSRLLKVIVARILIVLCLFLWGCFLSPPINITGTWIGSMDWTSGPATGFVQFITLVLVHEDRELTGAVTLPSHSSLSFEIPIVQGSARTVNMSLIARGTNPWITPEPTVEFAIEGSYEQTIMSGDGTQSIDGATYTFDWQAVLTTEPVPASL